jgi:hypothetical protein
MGKNLRIQKWIFYLYDIINRNQLQSRDPAFLTSALDGGELSALRPGRFTPRERAPGTHFG